MPLVLAVDFDNTIVKDAFPKIGEPVPLALEWLRVFQGLEAKIILWTVRCNCLAIRSTDVLQPAVQYLTDNGIQLFGVNRRPGQYNWSRSHKVHADIFIDDKNICTPLIVEDSGLCYVDWSVVGPAVLERLEKAQKAKKAKKP